MKKKFVAVYIANDGKEFLDKDVCQEYEKKCKEAKKQHISDIKKELKRLDDELWNKYYPNSNTDVEIPVETANLALVSDLKYILSDDDIVEDVEKELEAIQAIIKDSKYGDEIIGSWLNFDNIMEVVEFKRNLEENVRSTKKNDLASKFEYSFSTNDLRKLALLHKKGICRKKIEYCLESANFRQESDDFEKRKYEKYIGGK